MFEVSQNLSDNKHLNKLTIAFYLVFKHGLSKSLPCCSVKARMIKNLLFEPKATLSFGDGMLKSWHYCYRET
jgi:hypothetical protein